MITRQQSSSFGQPIGWRSEEQLCIMVSNAKVDLDVVDNDGLKLEESLDGFGDWNFQDVPKARVLQIVEEARKRRRCEHRFIFG